jgi:hypothetical protein
MEDIGALYEFVFRGIVAEEALDRSGRVSFVPGTLLDSDIAAALSLDLLDEDFVNSAKQMATVYTAIAAFENSVRKLISTRLLEELGESWWSTVSERIRTRAETRQTEESRNRYHAQRGDALINYTDLKELSNIIRQNWSAFEAYFPSIEWVEGIFNSIERSRNVIMHSGRLDKEDVQRLGIYIRDWVKQVGS